MDSLFPLGWQHYLIGGLLVGAGTAWAFLFAGVRAGASGFFSTTWSYVARQPWLATRTALAERSWRSAFALGLLLGAAGWALLVVGEAFTTAVPAWRLLAGGFLVGLGTRVSAGCTSGHGICGLSSGSRTSLAAVLTFMAVGIGTAWLTRVLGVAS